MNELRALLLAMLIVLAGYTAMVGLNHGWDLSVAKSQSCAGRVPGGLHQEYPLVPASA